MHTRLMGVVLPVLLLVLAPRLTAQSASLRMVTLTPSQRLALISDVLQARMALYRGPAWIDRCAIRRTVDRNNPTPDSLFSDSLRRYLQGDTTTACGDVYPGYVTIPPGEFRISVTGIRTEWDEAVFQRITAFTSLARPSGLMVVTLGVSRSERQGWIEEWVMRPNQTDWSIVSVRSFAFNPTISGRDLDQYTPPIDINVFDSLPPRR